MQALLCVAIIIGAIFAAALFTMMGVAYVEVGSGLHPAIVAIVVFLAGGAGAWAMGVLAELCGE